MKKLSLDEENLSFRSRFMYKDLIDLRKADWKVRREELKAKTINEIRKDAAREEREKERQSNRDYRGDSRRGGSSNRREPSNKERAKPVVDASGFTQVSHSRGSSYTAQQMPSRKSTNSSKSSSSSSKSIKTKNVQHPAPSPPAPKAPVTSLHVPLSKEKFELRTKNITNEFIQDPKNTAELLLSFDELSGTEKSGEKFVQICVDRIVDMKSDEIKSMVTMLQILHKKSKLLSSDIISGMGETIEFLDSLIFDCPKIFFYIGDILSKFLQVQAISIEWVCEATGKMFDKKELLIEETVKCVKEESGVAVASELFLKAESLLEKTLGSSEWKNIKDSYL